MPEEEPLAAAVEPPPAAPATAPAAAPTSMPGGTWEGLVEHLRQKRPSVGSHLEHGSLLEIDLPKLVIGYPKGSFHLTYWDDKETLDGLEALAKEYFGQDVRVKMQAIQPGSEAPPTLAATRQEAAADQKKKMEEDAVSHPVVKSALDILGGEVVSVSQDKKN